MVCNIHIYIYRESVYFLCIHAYPYTPQSQQAVNVPLNLPKNMNSLCRASQVTCSAGVERCFTNIPIDTSQRTSFTRTFCETILGQRYQAKRSTFRSTYYMTIVPTLKKITSSKPQKDRTGFPRFTTDDVYVIFTYILLHPGS
jgi:hypothetical protein